MNVARRVSFVMAFITNYTAEKVDSYSNGQEIPCLYVRSNTRFAKPTLLCSQIPATGPHAELVQSGLHNTPLL